MIAATQKGPPCVSRFAHGISLSTRSWTGHRSRGVCGADPYENLKAFGSGHPSVQEISLFASPTASVEELEAQLRPVLDLSPERADVLDALLDAFVGAERRKMLSSALESSICPGICGKADTLRDGARPAKPWRLCEGGTLVD